VADHLAAEYYDRCDRKVLGDFAQYRQFPGLRDNVTQTRQQQHAPKYRSKDSDVEGKNHHQEHEAER
jgi:hypothetical protein